MMGPGIQREDLAIIKQLGIVSQLRGLDGSGIYQTRTTKYNAYSPNYDLLFKTYSPFSSILDESSGHNGKYKELLNSVMVDVVIGHVRASTQGVISDQNAHPFEFDNIVGAHNGTLKDAQYLSHPVKTDSELMFKDISKRGITPVVEALDRDSAFAIVMYDKIDKHVYFVRNELRTLCFAFIKDRAVMYWASELVMLEYILKRNHQDYRIFSLHENYLIKINPNDITLNNNKKEDPLDILKVHKKLVRPLPTSYQKAKDEMERRKKLEKEKETKSNWTPDQYSFELNKTKDKGGKVLQGNFPQTKIKSKPFSVKSCYTRCACGKTTLNLLETNQTHRGIHPRYRYDKSEKKIYCDVCPDNKIECKEVV